MKTDRATKTVKRLLCCAAALCLFSFVPPAWAGETTPPATRPAEPAEGREALAAFMAKLV